MHTHTHNTTSHPHNYVSLSAAVQTRPMTTQSLEDNTCRTQECNVCVCANKKTSTHTHTHTHTHTQTVWTGEVSRDNPELLRGSPPGQRSHGFNLCTIVSAETCNNSSWLRSRGRYNPTYLRGFDSIDNHYIIAAFCEGTGGLKVQDTEIKAFRRKTPAGLFPILCSTLSLLVVKCVENKKFSLQYEFILLLC